MFRKALSFAFLAVACLLAGCAATPTVQNVQPVQAEAARHRAAQVTIDAAEPIRAQSGYDITTQELGREFIDNLLASGKFTAVDTTARTGAHLKVRLTITAFNYVSGAARGTAGILAGRAILEVRMTVTDGETGAELGVVTAGHSSSHAQGVFSPVTSTQLKAIAKELAAALTNR